MTEKLNVSVSEMQTPVIELPEGLRAVHKNYSIDNDFYTGKPVRSRFDKNFGNADDFVEFVKEYKEAGSKAFYSRAGVMVVFDFPLKDQPDYQERKASLRLDRTAEFETLRDGLRRNLTQRNFIRFLKQMETSITNIDGVELIDIIENLKAVKDVNSITKNTERGISINVKVESGVRNVSVPEKIFIEVPIFDAEPDILTEFTLECFYDYSDSDGKFSIEVECWDFDRVVEEATRAIVQNIVGRLEMKAYRE